jgi:hypothetical protein
VDIGSEVWWRRGHSCDGSAASRSHSEGSSASSLAPTATVVQSGARRDVEAGRGDIVQSSDVKTVCSDGEKANEVTCRSFYSPACRGVAAFGRESISQ